MSDEEQQQEEDWGEEEEAPQEEADGQEEEESPPPPPEEEEGAEEVAEEEVVEEEPVEEEVVEEVAEDAFVLDAEVTEETTEMELKVLYQAALTKVLLMELQSADASVVSLAARKLDNFFDTEQHAAHTDSFCMLGGHGLLLMLLQKWKDDQGIQECLFSCLAHLCVWAGNNNPTILSTVLIMRGMDLISDSMNRFPDSGQLYVDCLVTITSLCRKEDLDRHVTTRNSITCAVPLVCTAIKSFPENRNVLYSGCRALKAFCEMKLDEIKDLKGEAISVVGASLQNFPDDAEINTIAFSFLRNLGSMCGYGSDTEEAQDRSIEEQVQEEEPVQEVQEVQERRLSASKPAKKWGGKPQW